MINTSFWNGRRVLITGYTGFKGSWLLLWLKQLNADVWGISLPPENKSDLFPSISSKLCETLSNEQFLLGDINEKNNLQEFVQKCKPTVVFHLAAQPLVRKSYEDPLGTWMTNVIGSLNVLEALKRLEHKCAVVMITTDKVYFNQEWSHGYRETDRLGGHDPYSASKAAAELAIDSWRNSFVGNSHHQTENLRIATARAGNVIGGGDWACNRIVPDIIRALSLSEVVKIRNPKATRPWQHVLEPLSGYMLLAESLFDEKINSCGAFNFGPSLQSNKSVQELVNTIFQYWPGSWQDFGDNTQSPHEANLLHLQIDKAYHHLNWRPRWDYLTTVERTVHWYKSVWQGQDPFNCCLRDLVAYNDMVGHD